RVAQQFRTKPGIDLVKSAEIPVRFFEELFPLAPKSGQSSTQSPQQSSMYSMETQQMGDLRDVIGIFKGSKSNEEALERINKALSQEDQRRAVGQFETPEGRELLKNEGVHVKAFEYLLLNTWKLGQGSSSQSSQQSSLLGSPQGKPTTLLGEQVSTPKTTSGSYPSSMEKDTAKTVIIAATNPTTNKASILLINRKGSGTWSTVTPKDTDINSALTKQYGKLDLSKAPKEKITEGTLKDTDLRIASVNFVPADSLNAQVKDVEFTWIPVDEFLTTMTRVSKPLSSKGLTGQPALASVDYNLQKAIKELAPKIEASASQPISTSTTSTPVSSSTPQQGSKTTLGSTPMVKGTTETSQEEFSMTPSEEEIILEETTKQPTVSSSSQSKKEFQPFTLGRKEKSPKK
nr:hypothetical protein [Candidatus Dependentiae bacterium]